MAHLPAPAFRRPPSAAPLGAEAAGSDDPGVPTAPRPLGFATSSGPGAIRRLARRAGMHRFHYNPVWGLSRTSPTGPGPLHGPVRPLRPPREQSRLCPPPARPYRPSQRWGIGRLRPPRLASLLQGRLGKRIRRGGPPGRLPWSRARARIAAGDLHSIRRQPIDTGKSAPLRGIAARLLRGLPRGMARSRAA